MKEMTEMWTRSSRGDSRYVRGSVLILVRYGVLSIATGSTKSVQVGEDKNVDLVDTSKHIYSRSMLRCRIGATIRRTKLEASTTTGLTTGLVSRTNEAVSTSATYPRSGKRIQTYATESVKLIRLRSTRGCRMVSANRSSTAGRIEAYEYPILMMLATLGLMRLVNTNDRIGMYVAIEWLSLCLYVMAAFRRGSAYSTEAGLKYYVVGAFGSAWMLLGMTRIYGWRGSLNRVEIERRRVRGTQIDRGYMSSIPITVRIGWGFVRGAFLLKLGGVPLHRWLADVYEGAPRSSVLYFAVVPKIALFRVRMRRVSVWYVQTDETRRAADFVPTSTRLPVTNMRIVVSVRSMAVGAIGALTQRRRKRFRAYSTIGHTGYILLGVRRGTVEGVQGVRVYSIIYMVMSMVMWQRRMVVKVHKVYETPAGGVTSVTSVTSVTGVQVRDVKYRTDRYQLGKENPGLGLRIARTCMSMAGVPPMAGFGAKRSVFRALIASSYYRLGTIAVRLSVVGAFNYVRRVKRMFFEESANTGAKSEEISVRANKEVSRRRGREGRFRTRLRVHPSSLLLMTHRIALELVGR
jgi:NADH-quinone oxidoreductase subunit N